MTPICVMGGVSANSELDWWPGIVGPGAALDPKHQRLMGFDFARTTLLSTDEQAALLLEQLDAEGIDRIRIVGASYGGMVGLALASQAPERVERLVVLCAAHRPFVLGTAWRSIQRQILDLGIVAGLEDRAIMIARALAMTTFRTGAELDDRFSGDAERRGEDVVAPIDSYLEHHGRKYAKRHTAKGFRNLIASIDLHRVDPAHVPVPVHVIGFHEDQIVPPSLLHELAQGLPQCVSLDLLSSIHGHDGFLIETDALTPLLNRALEAA